MGIWKKEFQTEQLAIYNYKIEGTVCRSNNLISKKCTWVCRFASTLEISDFLNTVCVCVTDFHCMCKN